MPLPSLPETSFAILPPGERDMVGFEDLGGLSLQIIFSKLGPKGTAVFGCVCHRFRVAASDEIVWYHFCSQDFNVLKPEDPSGNPTSSFKATYKIWTKAFGMYPLTLMRRAKSCWETIKKWTSSNFQEVGNTLQKGASEAEISAMEDSLGLKLPVPTRVLYRFCNGQGVSDVDSRRSKQLAHLGLIGGYRFYDHLVNVHLLPLSEVIRQTKTYVHRLGFSSRSKYIVVAASSYAEKFFFLNCMDGQLYVGTGNLSIDGEMMPCVPAGLVKSVHAADGEQQQDAMLLWLEEHGSRLQSGMIQVREEGKSRSICLFPEAPPQCSTAVTNGVQVRASAVFVPEACDLQNEENKYLFSYSIRMRLLTQGNFLDGIYFTSCQLHWRHWIIRANDIIVSDVSDEAVIGKYPLLFADGEEFVYASCTPLPSSSGSVEGAFTFVPGRLMDRKGRQFDVEVAQFPCQTKKHVESSLDGQIEEIVYKGTHNHPKPQTTRTKTDAPQATQASREAIKVEGWSSWANYPLKMNSESLEISSSASVVTEISDPLYVGGATTEQMESAGTPDNSSISFRDDEFDLNSQRSRPRDVGFDDDEHDTKRWRKESENDGISASCRTVREPRVVIQTISDIDILEDGYKWRKYGQKVVKGNHNPRSYYKCTKVGCSVRKHVERASHDAKAVITSYEGTHNHDIPATRVSSSHGLALMLASDNNLEVPTMSFNNHMRSNSSFGGRTHASVEEYTPFTLEMLQSPHSFGYSGFENSCGTFMGVVNNMEIGISKEEAKEEPRDDSFFESLLY